MGQNGSSDDCGCIDGRECKVVCLYSTPEFPERPATIVVGKGHRFAIRPSASLVCVVGLGWR